MWISARVRNGPPEVLADRIMRGRLRSLYIALPVYALMVAAISFDMSLAEAGGWDTGLAWFSVTIVLASLLVRDPSARRVSPEVGRFLNDDLTRAHRASAQQTGFWVAVVLGTGFCLLGWMVAIDARQIAFMVVSGAVGAALFRFLLLERRALAA